MKAGRIWLLILFALCGGCASQPQVALLDGVSQEGAPVCLEDQAKIPAFVRLFHATRDLTTEEGKIDYLIQRVHDSKLTFVRNKVEYTGASAAEFLRWKMNRMEKRHKIKIRTVQDFISKVTSGSRTSGQPYAVILPNGRRHNLQNVLQNELDVLESCLKQYSEEENSPKQTISTAVNSNAGAAGNG